MLPSLKSNLGCRPPHQTIIYLSILPLLRGGGGHFVGVYYFLVRCLQANFPPSLRRGNPKTPWSKQFKLQESFKFKTRLSSIEKIDKKLSAGHVIAVRNFIQSLFIEKVYLSGLLWWPCRFCQHPWRFLGRTHLQARQWQELTCRSTCRYGPRRLAEVVRPHQVPVMAGSARSRTCGSSHCWRLCHRVKGRAQGSSQNWSSAQRQTQARGCWCCSSLPRDRRGILCQAAWHVCSQSRTAG